MPPMMSVNKKKCRQYCSTYLKFGFVPLPSNSQLPMCLLCNKVLPNEAMQPSFLQEHVQKIHPDKQNKDLSFFMNIRDKFLKAPSVSGLLATSSKECNDGLTASYNISKLIAKLGKAHTISEELILPAVKEVLETVLHLPAASNVIKNVPLSSDTVRRRIDEMAEDVEVSLCKLLIPTEFSLQVDESTLPSTNETLLLAYVRFVKEGKNIQEMLFARSLIADTKGESIFNTVKDYFKEKNIPLANIMSVATDGAPAMVGRHREFIALLKKEVPGILAVHCVIHRQHLVAKNLSARLHQSLQYVISAVNKICSNALDPLFGQLCKDNDEDFSRLLLHTEVRWLSKGTCLNRFWNLFDSVLEFLEEKDVALRDRLLQFKIDVAYMTDLFAKFSGMNLQLQGEELNLITTKSVISAFVRKLTLWKQNFGRNEFRHFPILSDLHKSSEISFNETQVYCQHLESLHKDFSERFEDILSLEVPQWVMNPFMNIETAEVQIQEELVELSTNEILKASFQNGDRLTEFWLQSNISRLYPGLWTIVKKFLIAFPSSYLVERGFSAVTDLITKKRSQLQIVEGGDLRLYLSNNIEPDVQKLALNHQAQPSH